MVCSIFRDMPAYFTRRDRMKLLLSLLSIIVLSGCSEMDSQTHKPSPKIQQITDNQFILPAKRMQKIQFIQDIQTIQKTELKVDGHWQTTEQESNIKVSLARTRDSAMNETIVARYLRLQILLNKDGEKQEIDADHPPTALHSVDNILRAINQSEISFQFDSQGRLVRQNGQQAIKEKVMQGLQHFNESERATVQNLLDMFTGEAFFKSNNLQNLRFFPTDTLELGQSWAKYDSVNALINLVTTSTYTLKAIDDSIARVDLSGKITNGRSESVPVMGSFMDVDLEGELEGQVSINLFTGLITSQESTLQVKGTLSLRGKEFPVKIRQTKKMTANRI